MIHLLPIAKWKRKYKPAINPVCALVMTSEDSRIRGLSLVSCVEDIIFHSERKRILFTRSKLKVLYIQIVL